MLIPVDPECGEQGYCQIDHFLGFGNDNGAPFEAAKPVALPAVIALIPQQSVDFGCKRLTTWSCTSELIATCFALFLGFSDSRTVFDESIAGAFGTSMHRHTPSQPWSF